MNDSEGASIDPEAVGNDYDDEDLQHFLLVVELFEQCYQTWGAKLNLMLQDQFLESILFEAHESLIQLLNINPFERQIRDDARAQLLNCHTLDDFVEIIQQFERSFSELKDVIDLSYKDDFVRSVINTTDSAVQDLNHLMDCENCMQKEIDRQRESDE
jgi:hypothetical protein